MRLPLIIFFLASLVLAVSPVIGADAARDASLAETDQAARQGDQAAKPVDEKPGGDDDPTRDGEEREWDQKVAVTAELEGMPEGPLGTVSTVVTPERIPGIPSTATDLVVNVPGVSENGQGGLLQVFSIRGVSRQRVLNFVSGMRLYADRRAGVSISFIEPYLLGKVDVLRGAATTFLGSGAIGGAVQVTPRRFSDWFVQAGYDTVGDQNYQVLGYGKGEWSFGLARRNAQNGHAPDGTELNDHFTQYSGVLEWQRQAKKRSYEVLWVPSYGEDIGKSNSDFPSRTTNYPRERHQMLRFATVADSGWKAQAWVHAHDLQTEVVDAEARALVDNDSFDWGLRWEQGVSLPAETDLHWGVDGIGRNGVSATETVETLEQRTTVKVQSTLDDAEQFEGGLFATGRWDWSRVHLQAGARLSWQTQRNAADPRVDDWAPNGFVGLSGRLSDRLELRGNLSSGLRFPSLAELFFSGTTGRGKVVGNPELEPERSLNAEVSLRWTGTKLMLNAGVFRNAIDDYIERDQVAENLLTFVNLTSGTIRGVEMQGMWLPSASWILGFGGHAIEGRDDDDMPLTDIPPDQLWVEGTHRAGRWTIDLRWAHRFDKDDPGSGEQSIPSADIVTANVAYRVNGSWSLALVGANLLDEDYYRSADDQAPLASERSVGLQFRWTAGVGARRTR